GAPSKRRQSREYLVCDFQSGFGAAGFWRLLWPGLDMGRGSESITRIPIAPNTQRCPGDSLSPRLLAVLAEGYSKYPGTDYQARQCDRQAVCAIVEAVPRGDAQGPD